MGNPPDQPKHDRPAFQLRAVHDRCQVVHNDCSQSQTGGLSCDDAANRGKDMIDLSVTQGA